MDRKLARTNIRFGRAMLVAIVLLLGSTFAWAAIYLNAVVTK